MFNEMTNFMKKVEVVWKAGQAKDLVKMSKNVCNFHGSCSIGLGRLAVEVWLVQSAMFAFIDGYFGTSQ